MKEKLMVKNNVSYVVLGFGWFILAGIKYLTLVNAIDYWSVAAYMFFGIMWVIIGFRRFVLLDEEKAIVARFPSLSYRVPYSGITKLDFISRFRKNILSAHTNERIYFIKDYYEFPIESIKL